MTQPQSSKFTGERDHYRKGHLIDTSLRLSGAEILLLEISRREKFFKAGASMAQSGALNLGLP